MYFGKKKKSILIIQQILTKQQVCYGGSKLVVGIGHRSCTIKTCKWLSKHSQGLSARINGSGKGYGGTVEEEEIN